jgi:hypothetical protein
MPAIVRAGVEQRQDVRVLELRRCLDFLDEAVPAEDSGQLGLQDFDRDFAIVPEVFREVDGGHAAGAELALDSVAVGECGGEARPAGFVTHRAISVPAGHGAAPGTTRLSADEGKSNKLAGH